MNVGMYLPDIAQERRSEIRTDVSFKHFILKEGRNRKLLFIAAAGATVQFLIFKLLLYPFPDFISDSYSYIDTNLYHMDVNLWPAGYSKFIWFIHLIHHSDLLLIAIQHFILELSLIYFFYTILYLYRPAWNTTIILYLFLFFNPLFLYLSNCVLSDALFSALTIVFIAQFLWMLHRPRLSQVLIQGIIIGIAFTIRYTAMYYPVVAIAGLLLSNHRPVIKIWGSVLGIALMIPFYIYTQQKTKEITGTPQFSVFGGWQIANNALYMYGHIQVDSTKLPPATRQLDRVSRWFFKNFKPSEEEMAAMPGTYFMKHPYAILKPYMLSQYTFDDSPGQFKAWGMVSPVYQQYGNYLISHYPLDFARYYLWLNTKNYFIPHLEKFGTYNLESDSVWASVQYWFRYKTPAVKSVSKYFQGKLFFVYPVFFMVLNLYFAGAIIWLLLKGQFKKMSRYFYLTLIFIIVFLIVNFGFSVLATPVVLRYQVVPMVILLTFSLLLLEYPDNPHQLRQASLNNL